MSHVKLRINVKNQEVTSDYVFDSLFKMTKVSQESNLGRIAKELVKLAAKRGDAGLFAEDWEDVIKKYEVSRYNYFFIIKTLKSAGILRKTKGRYYVIKDFNKHLTKMVTAMNEFYMDIGVEL